MINQNYYLKKIQSTFFSSYKNKSKTLNNFFKYFNPKTKQQQQKIKIHFKTWFNRLGINLNEIKQSLFA